MSATPSSSRQPLPLGIEPTPMLGREREAATLRELLDDPSIRLVTLTGPGGVGKTRLALHVATQLRGAFADAVAVVPLAAVHEPAQVLPEIAQALDRFSEPHTSPVEQIAATIADDPFLLILDNLEQVLPAALAIADLLARCPRLTILATSQAPLAIAGEQLYPIAPLPTPDPATADPERILATDAVALFVERARAVRPDLALPAATVTTIAEICRQLDGLPLAIELAAARTSVLSPEALLARLSNRLQVLGSQRRDLPDRLRTLRSAITWTYDLLPPAEQTLFRHLAVFAGGCTLEAIEAIARTLPGAADDPIGLLGTLVDHSLVQVVPQPDGEARYQLLETLRHFGLERLDASGERDTAHRSHARLVADLAAWAEPRLTGPDQIDTMRALDAEAENIRAAATWALDTGHPELALRILGALWRYAPERPIFSDYRDWLERALAAGQDVDPAARATAELGAGYLAEDARDLDTASAHFAAALAIAQEQGDPRTESAALIGLGTVAHDRADYARARVHHEAALAAARRNGEPRPIAIALGNVAAVSYFQGQLDDAERAWDEALDLIARLGEPLLEATTASNLAALASERGDYARAEALLTRTLALQRQMASRRDLPFTLNNLGEAARGLGDYTLAHDCYAEALELTRAAGNTVMQGQTLHGLAALALDRGSPTDAASLLLESMPLLAAADDQHSIVENIELLARICSGTDRHERAVELLAAASALRETLDTTPNPVRCRELATITEAARAALPIATIAAQQEAGRALAGEALLRRVSTIAREVTGPRHAPVTPAPPTPNPPEPTPTTDFGLTNREREVLRQLAGGASTREIAEALYISPRTATTHITHILAKLEVNSRTAAVAIALREGLV